MSSNWLGYIDEFDGIVVADDTTSKALTLVGNTDEVIDAREVLANGTVVNYNGTADAGVRPGSVIQRMRVTYNASGYYNTFSDRKGNRAVAQKELFGTSINETCMAVLVDVVAQNGSFPAADKLIVDLHFEFDDYWH